MKKNLKAIAQWYKDNDCEYLFSEEATNLLTTKPIINMAAPVTKKNKIESAEVVIARAEADNALDLHDLITRIKAFDGCEIKKSSNTTVIGDGDVSAKVMLIGEAPGANEDKEGIPFCGQSGKLLNNIIKSIGLLRDKVYITNTVFWRPPANRRPTTEEIDICRPLVEKHIALINPNLIILVGNTAVESLLNMSLPMGEMRQRKFEYNNQYLSTTIPTVVIYHPSYLLRQSSKKKEMWADMQYIKHHFITL